MPVVPTLKCADCYLEYLPCDYNRPACQGCRERGRHCEYDITKQLPRDVFEQELDITDYDSRERWEEAIYQEKARAARATLIWRGNDPDAQYPSRKILLQRAYHIRKQIGLDLPKSDSGHHHLERALPWMMKISLDGMDGTPIGLTQAQEVVDEILGIMEPDEYSSSWSMDPIPDDQQQQYRNMFVVNPGSRTSDTVVDALSIWKKPICYFVCQFENRRKSMQYVGYSEEDSTWKDAVFIEACELMAFRHTLWIFGRSGTYQTRQKQEQGREAYRQFCRDNHWGADADPVISTELASSIQDWKNIHGQIDDQRCKEFENRFGKLSPENLHHWRAHEIAPGATKEFPIYIINYVQDDQGDSVTGSTDDPFLRDKVRYIRKHWKEEVWKEKETAWTIKTVRKVGITDRDSFLESMESSGLDGGKRQATVPYCCTTRLWESIDELERIHEQKITQAMIENSLRSYFEGIDDDEDDEDDDEDDEDDDELPDDDDDVAMNDISVDEDTQGMQSTSISAVAGPSRPNQRPYSRQSVMDPVYGSMDDRTRKIIYRHGKETAAE